MPLPFPSPRPALRAAACAIALSLAWPGPATAQAQPQAPLPGMPTSFKPRPQMGTGAAFAPDGSLWIAALDKQGRLYLQTARRQGSGKRADWQWSAPRLLDTDGDPVAADGENHPKLLFGPKGLVLVAYTRPLDQPFTGYVRLLRSTDGGQHFAAPRTVHADRQVISHRFESLAFDEQGALHAVWIDKRDLEAAQQAQQAQGSANGTDDPDRPPAYRGAAIYRNVSRDGGATFSPDAKVADHACECCRIALAKGSDGRLRALWRHVFPPNVRDHAFALIADGQPANAYTRATYDGWRVDGCPHHGPSLAADDAQGFHAVWFGLREENGQTVPGVRYARLRPDGQPDPATVQRLPDDRAEHADLLAHGKRVAIAWRSTNGMTTTLKAWLSTNGGQHFTERTLAQAEGENDQPRLVQQGPRMSVVWRTSKEMQVHDLDF